MQRGTMRASRVKVGLAARLAAPRTGGVRVKTASLLPGLVFAVAIIAVGAKL